MPSNPQSSAPSSPCTTRDQAPEAEIAPARERALSALRSRLPELTQVVVSSLLSGEPAYRGGSVPAQEPPLMVGKSIENALTALRIPTDEREESLEWPRVVGGRRITQGVPLETIMRAYSLGGEVVAGALTQWAVEDELRPPEAAALLDDLWRVVEEHSAAALGALRVAETELSRGQTAGVLLDALLNGATDTAGAVTAVATCYALPEEGRYAVVVRRPTDGGPLLEPGDLPARVAGIRLIWRMHGESAIAVAVLGDLSAPTLTRGLAGGDGCRTGVSIAVAGLAGLGRARQLAELAARTLTRDCGVAVLEDHLQAAILTAQPDLANELKLHVLAPVLELDPMSRDLVLDTFAAWLRADGSAAQAATVLYCHRNTVQNRLRRLERLTRRSLAIPRHLIELSLALEAFQLQRRPIAMPHPGLRDLTPRLARP